MSRLLLVLMTICSMVSINAQTKITGTVVFAGDNEPLVGATVIPVGGGNGVVTNVDGRFSIIVPKGVKFLNVSYVGMITKQVEAAAGVVVALNNSNNQLDEVVVTAMGVKRDRKALGFAAQDLKAEDLNTEGTTSLASAIQGKLTGVSVRQSSGAPGASAQIVIRGARSFDGNNAPLYVIDGMPISTTPDFSTGASVTGADISDCTVDINPEDIESINVLKGQAASALYGIRASNGVIVITTKRGSLRSSRPTVTISTNLSAERVSRKFKRQTVYSQGTSGTYSPTSSMSWGSKISDLANHPVYGGNTDNKYTQASGKHEGMYYNPKRAQAGLDGWETPTIYDNVGDFLGTGFTENANVNVSQKKDGLDYSFGVSNSYQKGIIPSTGMTRWGVRGLVEYVIDQEWKTGFSLNYTSSRITGAPGANSGIMNVVYSCPAEYNLKGIPYNVPGDPTQQVLFRSTTFNNPYWWAENDEYSQHTNRTYGNAFVEYHPDINWGEDMNALKARYKLHTLYRNQDVLDEVIDAAQKAVNLGFSGMYITSFNGVTCDNPWSAYVWSRFYTGCTTTVADIMESTDDPRIEGYCVFNLGTQQNPDWQIVACEPGDEENAKESYWYFYPVWIDYSPSIQVMSEAELYFILAEAYARKGNMDDAKMFFDDAVRANFGDYEDIYGVDFGADAFLAQWADGVTLKDIMVQKYISQIRDEQIEAYNDIRRCKALGETFITLTNPWNNQSGINRWPERLPYGNSSVISNSKIKEAYGDGSYIFSEKVWLYGGTR